MAYNDAYRIRHRAAVSTAITILQLQAGSTAPFEVVKAWLTQEGSATSTQNRIQFARASAAATVTAGVVGTHVFKLQGAGAPTPSLQLGTTGTGVLASAEGILTDMIDDTGFNIIAGWDWVSLFKGHCVVPAAGLIVLKFPVAPTNLTWSFGMDIIELG